MTFELKSASSYRVSTLSNFADVEYKAFNNLQSLVTETIRLPVGVSKLVVYLEAVDSDGLTASKSVMIDREAPLFGEISLANGAILSPSQNTSFGVFAEGATYVLLTEDIKNISLSDKSLNWQSYAQNLSYTLSSSVNGSKKVYAIFKDDAQNYLGQDGSIFTEFILDTTAPNAKQIQLLKPESPTGAFNAPLVWFDGSNDVSSYEIEVSDRSDFSNVIRSKTLPGSANVWNIDPPLQSSGVYHWRIRAIDLAGNSSDWRSSSIEDLTSFQLVVLGTSLQAQYSVRDQSTDSGSYFGRNMHTIGDINGDGYEEVAYQRFSTETGDSSCSQCVAIDIFDVKSATVLQTLSESLDNDSNYGKEVVQCDLTGDGKDEIIVSSPYESQVVNNATYHNVGKIYVYNQEGEKLTTYAPDFIADIMLLTRGLTVELMPMILITALFTDILLTSHRLTICHGQKV